MLSKKSFKYYLSGQSVIEVIVAIGIFVIIASSAVVTVLGSFSLARLSKDEMNAVGLALEGISAVESIRNENWDDLADGDFGLSNDLGYWQFSGSSQEVGKFTRVISISSVDEDIKRIVLKVRWNFNENRQNEIVMETNLTNWQESRKYP